MAARSRPSPAGALVALLLALLASCIVVAAAAISPSAAGLLASSDVKISNPDLLLPSMGLVSFELKGYNGCFRWMSTNPSVVTLDAGAGSGSGAGTGAGAAADMASGIGAAVSYSGQQCRTSVRVRPTTSAPGRRTATVIAEEEHTGRTIRCDVTVDDIARFEVRTTRRIVHVGDFQRLDIEAFDSENNVFSSVEGLSFSWQLGSVDVLQLVPFRDAPVQATESATSAESSGRTTEAVVVRGVQPGRVTLLARLVQPGYERVAPQEVSIAVIEPLALRPAAPVLLPPRASIPFTLLKTQAGAETRVALPAARYAWAADNASVVTVLPTGVATALAPGASVIRVYDIEMPESEATGFVQVALPSTVDILMTDASGFVWTQGEEYVVEVAALDQTGRRFALTLSAELTLTATVPSCLDIRPAEDDPLTLIAGAVPRVPTASTPTARRFRIHARQACTGALEAQFAPVRATEAAGWLPARGRQDVAVQERLAVLPPVLRLPADQSVPHTWMLRVTGGSGAVDWRLDRSDVAVVSESGTVTARGTGLATVTAVDRRNPRNRATATVAVTPVAALRIMGPSAVRVGSSATLSLEASDAQGNVLHNVSQLAVGWSTGDAATVTLRPAAAGPAATDAFALREGGTDVTALYRGVRATHRLSTYAPLTARLGRGGPSALATPGCTVPVTYSGGPPVTSADDVQAVAQPAAGVTLRPSGSRTFQATCLQLGNYTLTVRVGAGAAAEEARVLLTCDHPALLLVRAARDGQALPTCEAESGRPAYFLPPSSTTHVYLEARSAAGQTFDDASSLLVQWTPLDTRLATLAGGLKMEREVRAGAVAAELVLVVAAPGYDDKVTAPLGIAPTLPQPLRSDQPLAITLPLGLDLPFDPILLDARNTFSTRARGGSGRFVYTSNATGVLALADHGTGAALMVPRGVGGVAVRADDTCSLSFVTATATVARVASARIESPAFVLVGNSVTVRVRVLDAQGNAFHALQLAPLNISLSVDGCDTLTLRPGAAAALQFTGVAASPCVAFLSAAVSAGGAAVRSEVHRLSVVAPLSLRPPALRLVPCSEYQLEAVAPAPGVYVSYASADPAVATVDASGFVRALAVGVTTVRATAEATDPQSGAVVPLSVAEAQVRVAPLSKIRVILPTARLHVGRTVAARVEGAGGESAAALAVPGASFVWDTASPDVAVPRPAFDAGAATLSVRLTARGAGSTAVRLRASFPACGAVPAQVLEDAPTLTVVEPLALVRPDPLRGTLLLTPSARARIVTNRDGLAHLTYTLLSEPGTEGAPAVAPDGTVTAGAALGAWWVRVEDTADGAAVAVRVAVRRVHAITLLGAGAAADAPGQPADVPVGGSLAATVQLSDAAGDVFDAADGVEIVFSRSSDAVAVVPGPTNHTVSVRALRQGRAMVTAQLADAPAVLDHVLVSVGDVVAPSAPVVHVGGTVNFSVPGAPRDGVWSVADGAVLRIDESTGVAQALSPGRTTVFYNSTTIRTHTAVHVVRVAAVSVAVPAATALTLASPAAAPARATLTFMDGTGAALRECAAGSDCAVQHAIGFDCAVVESGWAVARAVRTERGVAQCEITPLELSYGAAAALGPVDALTLRVRVWDRAHTYTIESTTRLPAAAPLLADTPEVVFAADGSAVARVAVLGRGVAAESSDRRVSVRKIQGDSLTALFEISLPRRPAERLTAFVTLRDASNAVRTVRVLYEPGSSRSTPSAGGAAGSTPVTPVAPAATDDTIAALESAVIETGAAAAAAAAGRAVPPLDTDESEVGSVRMLLTVLAVLAATGALAWLAVRAQRGTASPGATAGTAATSPPRTPAPPGDAWAGAPAATPVSGGVSPLGTAGATPLRSAVRGAFTPRQAAVTPFVGSAAAPPSAFGTSKKVAFAFRT